MNEQLWAGIALKVAHASFHLEKMQESISYKQPTHMDVVQMSAGAIVANNWQRSFYPHFDAFLGAARSSPMIIAASFGTDRGHPVMRDWLDHLDPDEQLRRRKFTAEFAPLHEVFRDHPLTQARDRVFHRTGIAPVTIRISDFFGVVHVGNPLCNVPTATSNPAHRGIGPERLAAVEPWHHSEFKLDGMPLFPLCTGYLEDANALVAKARDIAKRVHGDKPLSSPP